MSSIPLNQIDGDVSVGRNVSTGGDAKISGNAIVKRNLKVEGWLDARNIKGPSKGLYETVEKLRKAHPLPPDGWWALVGKSLPAPLYYSEGGEWNYSGGTGGNPTIDSESYDSSIEQLQGDVNDLKTNVKTAQKTANETKTELENISRITAQKADSGGSTNTLKDAEENINQLKIEVEGKADNTALETLSQQVGRKADSGGSTKTLREIEETLTVLDLKTIDTLTASDMSDLRVKLDDLSWWFKNAASFRDKVTIRRVKVSSHFDGFLVITKSFFYTQTLIGPVILQAGDTFSASTSQFTSVISRYSNVTSPTTSDGWNNWRYRDKGDVDLISNIITFNAVTPDAEIIEESTLLTGSVVYVTSKGLLALLASNGNYYSNWPDRERYCRDGGIPYIDKIYLPEDMSGFYHFGDYASRDDLSGLADKIEYNAPLYNVTEKVPLNNGYYSFESAIVAVPEGVRKKGLVVTYQAATDQWESKQYQSASIEDWENTANWTGFGSSSSGSGSGFYNVTQLHPLSSGYYTLATAVSVLQAAEINDEDKIALIITIEVSAGRWEEYRYTGTTVDGFYSFEAWERYGGGDAIKTLTVTKGTQTEDLSPDSSGNVNLDIPVIEVDQVPDPNSTNPISNKAVMALFEGLAGQYGAALRLNTIGSGDDVSYSLSLIAENGEVISTSDTFTGGGGSMASTRVILTRITSNPTVKNGDEVKLLYSYDQVEVESGESTGNPARATITIIRGATSNIIEKDIPAGTTDTIDVTPYLGVGSNTVRVRIAVGEGEEEQIASISWSVTVVQLTLTSSFNYASLINKGDTVSVPFALSGSGNKTLRMYLDGVDTEDRTINTSTANGSFSVNTSSLSHGSHSIQLVCELELSGGNIIKSNSIYFDIAVRENNKTTPVVATRFDYPDGTLILGNNRPYIPARQYDNYTLNYAVYNPTETPTRVDVYEGGSLLSSALVPFVANNLTVRALHYGQSDCKIVCADLEYTYRLLVSQSELNISEPLDGLELKLSAQGRSNNDVNKTEWAYRDITTEFSGIKWGGDGWINNALRLTDGGKATVNYQPLESPLQNITNAFTFLIKFKVSEVTDEEAEVIRCMDSNGTGFVITTQEARMVTNGNSSLMMKMAAGQTYEVGFVSYPKSGPNSSGHEILNSEMLYLYIDGIASGGVQRGTSDSIYQEIPQNIELGAVSGATLDVYLLRAYNTYLSDSQMLDCFIIDQDSVDNLIEKYNGNNILDGNGIVSVDSIPDDMRYVIVTGKQANGVATVLQAAINNDKNPKYDVDEILCVKRSEPELNFRLVGGCIRLQGTSSLAYPIKNYRIYLNDSKKQDGNLYLGVDSQGVGGELQEKAKYSFRLPDTSGKIPAPVNCFCLKADYAESSSSHNTGLARLTNDVLKSAGELTPAQKYVDPAFAYDVRTTVDGEPCLLFYRETRDDTPVLVGKFNFNNDKSTESVFGFLDIPGYHDQGWVTEKFSGENPTECWEFLNNDYPMGSFLDDDFDSKDETGYPNWLKVFEARFPDVNDEYEEGSREPVYLKALVKWVKSTENDPAKFRSELGNYFDVDYLCDYFMFTEIFGCVDQRVKNMMFGFWYDPDKGKMLCYPIFYDNDTILGVRNDGRLQYSWDINENTIDPELSTPDKTVYAYAGHNSVLWSNLRTQFADKLTSAYKRLRERMSNEYIFTVFDQEQAGKYCERLYNIDAQYKYVRPKTIGIEVNQNGVISNVKYSYLEAMQGSRSAHRRWWLTNRMHLFDARYSSGQYALTDITWKGNSAAGATVKATPSRDFYFEFRREGTTMVHSPVNEGEQWSYTYNQVANIGTIFHLLGGIFMSKLDLSEWGGFTDVNIPNLPVLEELTMGNTSNTYTLTELVIGDKLPMLRKLDIRNYTRIPSLDLTGCGRLEEVNAAGCSLLSSLAFPEGAPVSSLILPANYQSLTLRSLSQLTREGITFENKASISQLWIENCERLDGFALLAELFYTSNNSLRNIRITDMDVTGDSKILIELMNSGIGGIADNGSTQDKPVLQGKYHIERYISKEALNQLRSYFEGLEITRPEWTCLQYDIHVADDANITNLENKTGYLYGNSYQPSGHILDILNARHRVLAKKTGRGECTYYPLHDDNSNYYADAEDIYYASPAAVDGSEGNMFIYEGKWFGKGVNDYLNGRQLAYYSASNNMPKPTGERKTILFDSLRKNTGVALRVSSDYTTVEDAQVSLSNYYFVEVDIKGYKLLSFPMVRSAAYGMIITDVDGNIIKRVNLGSVNIPGIDNHFLFTEIPENAQRAYLTLANSSVVHDIELYTSSDPEILSEWHEFDECLVGVFKASVVNDVIKSVAGQTIKRGISYNDYKTYTGNAGDGFQLIDYDMHVSIANLFFAKYGRRNVREQCGTGGDGVSGRTVDIGMHDTVSVLGSGNYYQGIKYNDCNCLGYEGPYGFLPEFIDNIISNKYELDRSLCIDYPNGTERIIVIYMAHDVSTWTDYLQFGEHMDVVHYQPGNASSSTYYCDSMLTNSKDYNTVCTRANYGLINLTSGASMTSAANYVCGRLAFRGVIKRATNLNEYKQL